MKNFIGKVSAYLCGVISKSWFSLLVKWDHWGEFWGNEDHEMSEIYSVYRILVKAVEKLKWKAINMKIIRLLCPKNAVI